MNKTEGFARRFVAGVVAVALLAMVTATHAANVPQVVKVVRILGKAKVSTDNQQTWRDLGVGDILKPGCIIVTAEKSYVDVLLGEGPGSMGGGGGGGGGGVSTASIPDSSAYIAEEEQANIIRIFQSSVLAVDKLTLEKTGVDEVTDTQLDLRAGQIMGTVKKLSGGSHYEVKVLNGIAGIRGTVYVISSSGVVDVLKGAVMITIVAADGTTTTKLVPAKHSFDPATGVVAEIPPDVYGRLVSIYHECRGGAVSGPRVIHEDHTIIYISPLDGTSVPHGNGGGGGG